MAVVVEALTVVAGEVAASWGYQGNYREGLGGSRLLKLGGLLRFYI